MLQQVNDDGSEDHTSVWKERMEQRESSWATFRPILLRNVLSSFVDPNSVSYQ